MTQVKFQETDPNDDSNYIFVSKEGIKHHLYSDGSKLVTQGLTLDFWDKFYFCKKINVNYTLVENERVISKIISYK